MKVISKENLILIIPLIQDRKIYTIDDFELLLERFGDDYFIEDGILTLTKKNEEMLKIQNRANKKEV